MNLHLVDNNQDVVVELREAFKQWPGVELRFGNLLELAENCIVSPANGQGFMDGGFDRALVEFFGPGLQTRVMDEIARRPEGYLPVGSCAVVPTGHKRIPYVLVAPTMIGPEQVVAENAFRAFRAVLRAASRAPNLAKAVYCPGLTTGIGEVSPLEAAREMARAYQLSFASK